MLLICVFYFFFFQAEDGIRDDLVTGVQTCALPIYQACSRMWTASLAQEPTGKLLGTWIAKEELRYLLSLARPGAARPEISSRLFAFCDWCARADVPEVTTLAKTIEAWWPQILAFIGTGITNEWPSHCASFLVPAFSASGLRFSRASPGFDPGMRVCHSDGPAVCLRGGPGGGDLTVAGWLLAGLVEVPAAVVGGDCRDELEPVPLGDGGAGDPEGGGGLPAGGPGLVAGGGGAPRGG